MRSRLRPARNGPRDPAAAGGFMLIESVVALLVVSIGMLGLALAQLQAQRTAQEAAWRIAAVLLAAEMAERVQANLPGLDAYAGSGPGAPQSCMGTPVGCPAAQLALDDWSGWRRMLDARLPAGAGAEISLVDAGPEVGLQIRIVWPAFADAEPGSLTLAVQR